MVATLRHGDLPAELARWEPDPHLTDHFGHRARHLTDDELHREIGRIDHSLWLAVEAEIEHSTQYLVELASERAACEEVLVYRARRGYQYRDPAPRKFSRDTLDMLKACVSIEDEIAQTVDLQRRGKNHVARCPFHQPDRTPSFTVFPETQSYYCFGCHAHGDIFNWLMETRDLSFPDAVREVAARFGMPPDEGKPDKGRRAKPGLRGIETRMIPASRRGGWGREGSIVEYRAGKLVKR